MFLLETEMAQWQLDEMCLMIGRRVENNVNNGKDMWHDFPVVAGQKGARNYRSAKPRATKKVKIKNGIW